MVSSVHALHDLQPLRAVPRDAIANGIRFVKLAPRAGDSCVG